MLQEMLAGPAPSDPNAREYLFGGKSFPRRVTMVRDDRDLPN